MLFNSPEYFFGFLPVAVCVYYLLQRYNLTRAAKVWLVGASLYFYAYWNVFYIFLILSSILVNFSVAELLHRARLKAGYAIVGARTILICGVVFNLALLGYFKYTDFFIGNINAVLDTNFELLHLLLPLAISFFTFQQIAYLVDCYKHEVHDYDFLSYCLFVCFFPQLIAGPIVHHKEMMPQFSDKANTVLNYQNIAKGILIFAIGLFKKVVIADTFAIWADAGFSGAQNPVFFEAWRTTLCYTFQLYYDFSGYTDMAIGAALLFNIRLPINFNSPYKAVSIQDFWRRWHMTLSRWLRDYLYIPLGGNRKGAVRTHFNLFVTFLLGGLWHGAGWTFVLWGCMHGAALIVHRVWSNRGYKMNTFLAWLLTFVFVNFAWVMFRADDVQTAQQIMAGMLGMNGLGVDASLMENLQYYSDVVRGFVAVSVDQLQGPAGSILFLLIFGVIAFTARNSMEIAAHKEHFSLGHVFIVSGSVLLTLLLGIASTASVFLYFNF